MYLTYSEYQEMGGNIDETAFDEYSFRSEGIINRYTFNRLVDEVEIPYAVKRVMYLLINCIAQQTQTMNANGIVTSRSNDGVSESYSSMSPDSIYKNLEAQMGDIVLNGLTGIKNSKDKRLLYRGLYPDE